MEMHEEIQNAKAGVSVREWLAGWLAEKKVQNAGRAQKSHII